MLGLIFIIIINIRKLIEVLRAASVCQLIDMDSIFVVANNKVVLVCSLSIVVLLQDFRDGTVRVLITTNVAARGLDIPEVDLVVQVEPPSVSASDSRILQEHWYMLLMMQLYIEQLNTLRSSVLEKYTLLEKEASYETKASKFAV